MQSKYMATLFLFIGILSLLISTYLFTTSKSPESITEKVPLKKGLNQESSKQNNSANPASSSATISKNIKENENKMESQDKIDLSKEKGNEFEDFTIKIFSSIKGMKFLSKTSDYYKKGVYPIDNGEPDLKFSYKGKRFAVECKWRSTFHNNYISWAKDYQIVNYNKYQEKTGDNVYVAIGIGGKASNPQKTYLIPLKVLANEFVTETKIKNYEYTGTTELLRLIVL